MRTYQVIHADDQWSDAIEVEASNPRCAAEDVAEQLWWQAYGREWMDPEGENYLVRPWANPDVVRNVKVVIESKPDFFGEVQDD